MSTSDNELAKAPGERLTGEQVIARAMAERRRFRRVRVEISGRIYMLSTKEEAACTVWNISPGDVALRCDLKGEPTGQAILYLDSLGRFEGTTVRTKKGGLILTFSCLPQKRERLADQLTLELNRHLLTETDLRRHERVDTNAGTYAHFTRSTGDQIRCEVLDLSLTGVSVRTEARPQIGEHILIGHRAGRVARHHDDGIGIEFLGLALALPQSATAQDGNSSTPPNNLWANVI